jgi:allantoicase
MTDFTDLLDLAGARLGGRAVSANDEFFAERENLVKPEPAVFLPDEYTDRGKWMDGWETRRRREPGYDWCILRLGVPGIVRGVVVDTAFFRGNFPAECSLEGALVEGYPSDEELLADAIGWTELVPKSALQGDSKNAFPVKSPYAFNYVRLNIFPDGGVARLRVHGEPVIRFGRLPVGEGLVDLAAAVHGGRVASCSDMFFGVRHNLTMPGDPRNMGEGWETKRRRGPGHDFAIVRLAARGIVRRVEIDTSHFKGNCPARCTLEATSSDLEEPTESAEWWQVLDAPLRRDTRHLFIDEVEGRAPATHVRLNVFPDGGIARLRVHAEIPNDERERLGVRWLDALPPKRATSELLSCCGSKRFSEELAKLRPFHNVRALRKAADEVWKGLGEKDWLEAFAAHPRIGEKKLGKGTRARWSRGEQTGANDAGIETLEQLEQLNHDYEKKFGFVFLISATGKSAEEILASGRERFAFERSTELKNAAEEQRQITQLRIGKLLHS